MSDLSSTDEARELLIINGRPSPNGVKHAMINHQEAWFGDTHRIKERRPATQITAQTQVAGISAAESGGNRRRFRRHFSPAAKTLC